MLAPWNSPVAARVVFALTAVVSLGGVALQIVLSATNDEGLFPTPAGRAFNVLCYFTVQSNLIVGITTLLLAVSLRERGLVFNVLRLTGLVAISVTALVFHTTLRNLQELSGFAALADLLLHTLSPLLCIGGWLLFGPRKATARNVVLLTVVFPLAWAAFTFVRGPIVDFYPYPFLDVPNVGYPQAIINVLIVGVVFVGIAWLASLLDTWLARARESIA